MAEAGVGVYMLEIERMQRVLGATPRVAERFFTPAERAYCEGALLPAARYAACLAARPAVARALGLGQEPGLSRWDITLSFEADGVPRVELEGAARTFACERGIVEVAVSLSYTEQLAVANALALTAAARPKPKPEQADERRNIARSFREVRSVLDELERVQEDERMEGSGRGADVEPAAGSGPSAGAGAGPVTDRLPLEMPPHEMPPHEQEVEHEADSLH